MLFSASLIAEVLPNLWGSDPGAGQEHLEGLRRLTRGALAEMRMLLLELRPAALLEAELGDLLRQLIEAIMGRKRLPITLTIEGQRSVPPDVQIALYRIAQEALNNVIKHAGANTAAVSLVFAQDAVDLRVSDDGRGFDPGCAGSGRLGLRGMRERSQAIGATLRLESHPGQGTTVRVVWRDHAGVEPGESGHP
jgi:signal transduction histidine kinase